MFLLYFVLVSSGVTFIMNQWRQTPYYHIDVHEFTSELPKYMMMTCFGSYSDFIESPRSLRRFAKNTVAGHDMRFPQEPNHSVSSMESFHHHMQSKKMLDYLQHHGDDALVKLHMYQEYTRKSGEPLLMFRRMTSSGGEVHSSSTNSITGPCLKAGNWKDLVEFDFI